MKSRGLVSCLVFIFLIISVQLVIAAEDENSNMPTGEFNVESLGTLIAFFVLFFLIFLIIAIALYVYVALALIAIAYKTDTEGVWMAWVPIVNLILISRIAKMHWWPILPPIFSFLLFLLFFILGALTNSLAIGILLIITIIALVISSLILTVYYFIWFWKVFEAVEKPGWWILLTLIPFVGGIIFLVFLGIAAWGE